MSPPARNICRPRTRFHLLETVTVDEPPSCSAVTGVSKRLGNRRERALRIPTVVSTVESRRAFEPADRYRAILHFLTLVLTCGLLRREICELKRGSTRHHVQPELIRAGRMPIEATKLRLRVSSVMQFCERNLIEIAVGL